MDNVVIVVYTTVIRALTMSNNEVVHNAIGQYHAIVSYTDANRTKYRWIKL